MLGAHTGLLYLYRLHAVNNDDDDDDDNDHDHDVHDIDHDDDGEDDDLLLVHCASVAAP